MSRYTSATLFQCAQAFTFTMLALPALLCAICWFIAPRRSKAWILFPIASLLIGFSATSIHAIGEAAIATSCYWILLFMFLFGTRSIRSQALFLILCIPAFWLHEGAFPLTCVLLFACAARFGGAVEPRERLFVGICTVLLMAVLAYQLRWVVYPQFPGDRESLLNGFLHVEFLYTDNHFNLPFVTGIAALLALSAVIFIHATRPSDEARRPVRIVLVAWGIYCVAAMAGAVLIEQSYSPFAQLQARYHPVMIGALLGAAMIVLLRFNLPGRLWMHPAIVFILVSLCATQTVADMVATRRWHDYVVDLRSRLANGRGLIPWESTLHTDSELADVNWRLTETGWAVPLRSIVYAPAGVVNAIINRPQGTTYRPFDPAQPGQLPPLRGIDYAPYEGFLAVQKSGARP